MPTSSTPRTEEPCKIDGLGVCVADLDNAAPGQDETGKGPRDLDDALVRPARRLQPGQPLAARPRAQAQRHRVVELADARRLGGGDELVQERRAGKRAVREHPERPRTGLLVAGAAQDLAERALDELVVRARVRLERRCDLPVH